MNSKKRVWLFVFLVLMFVVVQHVGAQQLVSRISLVVNDASTHTTISKGMVSVVYGQQRITTYLRNGTLELPLTQENYTLIIDDEITPGNDYFVKTTLSEGTPSLSLFPIGSLRGIVKDTLANVVSKAQLSFHCHELDIDYPPMTDTFGFFATELPVGSCTITASFNSGVGYVTIDIKRGDLKDLEITLDKTILDYGETTRLSLIVLLFVLFLILIIISIVGFIVYKKKKTTSLVIPSEITLSEIRHATKEIKEPSSKEATSPHQRYEDILPTLNAKEQCVVAYLLEHNHYASQASLRHATKIPRTTLTRLFQTMESKKIITVEKLGKMVKVTLTDWFVGKK